VSILAIAGRELRSLFLSPLAWTVLAVVQVVLAWLFLLQLDAFMQIKPRLATMPGAPGITAFVVAPLFKTAAMVLLLVVPLLTMRLLSEEQRTGTLRLLLSAPVSMTAIVLGKYLAVLAFLGVVLALVGLMALSLLLGGPLDLGLVAAGWFGLALAVASFAAAGLFMSSLTAQPAVAATATLGLLLVLWIVDRAGGTGDEGAVGIFQYLSVLSHLNPLLRGFVDTRDVAYYLVFSLGFLVLAVHRLDARRLG
jgi:ABC-2 type transport system permease protein